VHPAASFLEGRTHRVAFEWPSIQLQAFMKAGSYPFAFETPCTQLQAVVKAEHVQLSLEGHAYS